MKRAPVWALALGSGPGTGFACRKGGRTGASSLVRSTTTESALGMESLAGGGGGNGKDGAWALLCVCVSGAKVVGGGRGG